MANKKKNFFSGICSFILIERNSNIQMSKNAQLVE